VLALLGEDAEFRNPRGGTLLRGEDGARALLLAAADADLTLVPKGGPELANDGRVAVPVQVVVGPDEMHGTAFFEVHDDRITAFEVVTEVVD
jgi:hypothetical protein